MSNLVPVQRPDKNGKVVTRHVKPNASSGKTKSIAPPSISRPVSIPLMRDQLADAVSVAREELSPTINDPEKIRKLIDLAETHDFTIASEDTAEHLHAIEGEDFDRCIGLLKRNFELADEVLGYINSKHREYAPIIATGLNLYPFDLSHNEEKTLTKATCLIFAHDAMIDDSLFDKVFPDQPKTGKEKAIGYTRLETELAKYVLKRPDDIDSIADIIGERKITDPKHIEEILSSSGANALTKGVL